MSRFVVRSFTRFTEFIHIYIHFFLNTPAKFELSELTLDFTFLKHIDRSNKCHNNARRIILGKPRAYWSSLYTETFAVLHKCSCELSPIFFFLLLLKLDLPFLGELTVLSVAGTKIWSVCCKLKRRQSWVRSIESSTCFSVLWMHPCSNFWNYNAL